MTRRRRLARWLLIGVGVLLAVLVAYEALILTKLWWWRDHNPPMTAFMDARLTRLRETKPDARLRQKWVPYANISSSLKRAVLVAEDDKFVDHDGFDWDGIQKALAKIDSRK